MGFMDKVKAQAEVAVAKAQQGMAQGQSKLDDFQSKRAADALLLTLGHAFYAEQRTGGSHEDVVNALAAVDAHAAENGPIAAPDAPVAQATPYAAGGGVPPYTGPSGAASPMTAPQPAGPPMTAPPPAGPPSTGV